MDTIYLPGRGGLPPEPAPYLMTDIEAARFLRLSGDVKSIESTLQYYRASGRLRAVQVGRHMRYRIVDLVRFLDQQAGGGK